MFYHRQIIINDFIECFRINRQNIEAQNIDIQQVSATVAQQELKLNLVTQNQNS